MEVIDKGLVLVSVHMFRPVIASPVLLLSIVEHAWLLHIFILPTNIVVTVNRVRVESLECIDKIVRETETMSLLNVNI